MKRLKIIFSILALIMLGFWGVRLYNTHRPYVERETRFMMDTYVSVSVAGPKEISSKAADLALDRMQEIDVKFNALNPKSPLYAFNHKNEPITDPEIIGLIRAGLEVSKKSGGAFDMTVAPLIELWGFNSKEYYVPEEAQIKDCLKSVGYEHLWCTNGKLEKDSGGVKIDLGGIGKGYALSEAVKVLKAQGITSALIDAGGDVYTLGKKGKKLWRVGIKNPRGNDIIGYVEAEDLAVVGSGDYERFFIKDGKRYHHIFDPKTGYPTEGVAGVTLLYPDPVLAQAWAKIPFVLGPKKGLELLEKIPGMEAIIITASGEKLYSAGLTHTLHEVN
jgi:thiamine biosynthesis lipoprotein